MTGNDAYQQDRQEIGYDVYQKNGFENRADYLHSLSEEYSIPEEAVLAMAEVLGPEEDFDGLVSSLEDAMYGGWFEEDYDE